MITEAINSNRVLGLYLSEEIVEGELLISIERVLGSDAVARIILTKQEFDYIRKTYVAVL